MRPLSFKRHRFPAAIIRHAVWLYLRFTLSSRDVEELLVQRGIEVSYETIRCWTIKFGPQIARNLERRRSGHPRAGTWTRWSARSRASACTSGGPSTMTGEVLDLVVQKRRDTEAALKLLKRLLRNQPVEPETIVTDGLRSYSAALTELGLADRHRPGRLRENNRAENSHLPIRRRERKMPGFKARLQPRDSSPPTPRFTTPSTYSNILSADPRSAALELTPKVHGLWRRRLNTANRSVDSSTC